MTTQQERQNEEQHAQTQTPWQTGVVRDSTTRFSSGARQVTDSNNTVITDTILDWKVGNQSTTAHVGFIS